MNASFFLLAVLALCLSPGDSRFIIDPASLLQQNYLSLDTCSECSQMVQLSANMISSRDTKETVYKTLHALCQRLPGDQRPECESQVKTYLPKVLQQTSSHLKPAQTCAVFGLCAAHKEEEQQKLSHHDSEKDAPSPVLDTQQELFTPVCSLCVLVIKKLETLLPENMTEDALMKLMEEVCDLIPQSYKDQCDGFVDQYGTEIVEFLLSSAAPHTICTLLHLCMFQEQTLPEVLLPSDCDSCRTLAVLSRLHLGPNSTQPEVSSFLQAVCAQHPKAIPKCESFTKVYGPGLQEFLGNQKYVRNACERADICAASKKMELLGKNRCTWGPKYWCKDVETAKKCGNQAFCEKFMWKE